MEYNIKGLNSSKFNKDLKKLSLFIMISPVVVIMVNFILSLFLTSNNYHSELIVNSLIDAIFGSFYFFIYTNIYQHKKRIVCLCNIPKDLVYGQLKYIDNNIERYNHFDCIKVEVDNQLYYVVWDNSLILPYEKTVKIEVSTKIITSITVIKEGELNE